MEYLLIILNLVIIEALLSVDNAAVLATMVKYLPGNQSERALKYGMVGAYVFRGICLLAASILASLWWLKGLGGLYLLWLAISHFTSKNDSVEENVDKGESAIFKFARTKLHLNQFWATVLLVEIMDLAFSIDNVLAAVAMSDQLWVIVVGVFIGIAAMRFVAGYFLKLMKQHPALETSAFWVIGVLGVKLVLESLSNKIGFLHPVHELLENHYADFVFSAFTILIFLVPLIKDWVSKKKN